jgi:hypothetical protein
MIKFLKVIIDFEIANYLALREIFKDEVNIIFCFFHFI